MRSNKLMRDTLERVKNLKERAVLHESLSQLLNSEILVIDSLAVFAESYHRNPHLRKMAPDDPTGFESLLNHEHIEDILPKGTPGDELIVQALIYAELLFIRLKELGIKAQVILGHSIESDAASVRFTTYRPGLNMVRDDDDLEGFKLEGMAVFSQEDGD